MDKLSNVNQVSSWLQASLLTRPAGSYFGPLLQGVAPDFLLPKRYRRAKVLDVIRHNGNAVTLILKPPSAWVGFVPGQFVSCEIEVNGVRVKRNYSISSTKKLFDKTACIEITVHRVAEGLVSNYVVDSLRAGAQFYISDALGGFASQLSSRCHDDATKPLIFLAAGSGITPFASIVGGGLMGERPALLVYTAAHKADHLFKSAFAELDKQLDTFHTHCHTTQSEASDKRIDTHLIQQLCIESNISIGEADIFICGSHSFTQSMMDISRLLTVVETSVFYESFDSKVSLPFAAKQEGLVHFSKSQKTSKDSAAENLLELAESIGLSPDSGCRMGICCSCTCTKKSGVVRNKITGDLSSSDEEEIRLCISQAVGKVDIDL